jgi:hypothetical protein
VRCNARAPAMLRAATRCSATSAAAVAARRDTSHGYINRGLWFSATAFKRAWRVTRIGMRVMLGQCGRCEGRAHLSCKIGFRATLDSSQFQYFNANESTMCTCAQQVWAPAAAARWRTRGCTRAAEGPCAREPAADGDAQCKVTPANRGK